MLLLLLLISLVTLLCSLSGHFAQRLLSLHAFQLAFKLLDLARKFVDHLHVRVLVHRLGVGCRHQVRVGRLQVGPATHEARLNDARDVHLRVADALANA